MFLYLSAIYADTTRVMQLDLLSKALTEFHALQAPTVEFPRSSSGQNTATPGATPPTSHSTPSSIPSPSAQDGDTTSPANSNLLLQNSGAVPSLRDSVISGSLSRTRSTKVKHAVSPLKINAVLSDKQTHMIDSPASMGGAGWDSKPPTV
jgi:uncharacterized protein YkwD